LIRIFDCHAADGTTLRLGADGCGAPKARDGRFELSRIVDEESSASAPHDTITG
jgi:hypothetical protein